MKKKKGILAEWNIDEFKIRVIRGLADERQSYEKKLEEHNFLLPLNQRYCWIKGGLADPGWFIAVLDRNGRCCYGAGIDVIHRRALPGTVVLRIDPFGDTDDVKAINAVFVSLRRLAQSMNRILRVHIAIYSLNTIRIEALETLLANAGYHHSSNPRNYQETVTIDLTPALEEIFRSFHPTARRHIRAINKYPVEIRRITDPASADAVSSLVDETMTRTGGSVTRANWPRRIQFSAANPTLSRIVGLYATGKDIEDRLLAIAWGCIHGHYAQYSVAASTRTHGHKIPMGYALAWDLICWTKRLKVSTFDFGGITTGSFGSEGDPLGGISDFKRYFTTNQKTVSSEWIYEPRPWVAGTVDIASDLVKRALSNRRSSDHRR